MNVEDKALQEAKDRVAKKHGKISWAILYKYYWGIVSDEDIPLRKRREAEEDFFAIENEAMQEYASTQIEAKDKEIEELKKEIMSFGDIIWKQNNIIQGRVSSGERQVPHPSTKQFGLEENLKGEITIGATTIRCPDEDGDFHIKIRKRRWDSLGMEEMKDIAYFILSHYNEQNQSLTSENTKKIDLKKIQQNIDEALDKETTESLTEWLLSKREGEHSEVFERCQASGQMCNCISENECLYKNM